MKSNVRPVTMYYGFGTDYGTWHTAEVEIPIDTPENLINDVAIQIAKENSILYDNQPLVFVGVYSIMPLEDVDEYYDWCNEKDSEALNGF